MYRLLQFMVKWWRLFIVCLWWTIFNLGRCQHGQNYVKKNENMIQTVGSIAMRIDMIVTTACFAHWIIGKQHETIKTQWTWNQNCLSFFSACVMLIMLHVFYSQYAIHNITCGVNKNIGWFFSKVVKRCGSVMLWCCEQWICCFVCFRILISPTQHHLYHLYALGAGLFVQLMEDSESVWGNFLNVWHQGHFSNF